MIQIATVIANTKLCREHYRLTVRVTALPAARPGQFVHLSREASSTTRYGVLDASTHRAGEAWVTESRAPMLRRAFSIAGLQRNGDGADIDVIYRVVGRGTRWMESLAQDDRISILAPLGNGFPISKGKPKAWLIAGGVGLPPMHWLAEALHAANRQVIAFCGAQSADLLALTIDVDTPPAADASTATLSAAEFARYEVPVVISTDDGSLGYHGYIGAAMAAYHQANPTPPDQLVVYTCGPEPMMRFVTQYCLERGIECYACMERSMACGTGTCQSCVVPVHDDSDPQGWRYRLCCTEGPVFNVKTVAWEPAGTR